MGFTSIHSGLSRLIYLQSDDNLARRSVADIQIECIKRKCDANDILEELIADHLKKVKKGGDRPWRA
jgi:hypothetical protein